MIDQRIANKARATFDDYATALPDVLACRAAPVFQHLARL
jgi:hypothetical protein